MMVMRRSLGDAVFCLWYMAKILIRAWTFCYSLGALSSSWCSSSLNWAIQCCHWPFENVNWWSCVTTSQSSLSNWDNDKKEHWQNFDIFWEELKHFNYSISPHYYFLGQFENEDAIEWCTHIWYEMHSIPFTKVLGFVACWNTSQHLSMGSAEQYWSDLNMIKDGKRENLGGESLENSAILYTSAKFDNAQIPRNTVGNSKDGNVFRNYDIQ